MAYASWLTPDPTSGSGTQTVTVSASVYTGRVARSTTMTFSAVNCADVPVTVNQTGKAEFVTIQQAAAVDKAGAQALTISGSSNSRKLTFSLGSSPTLVLTLPSTYTADGITTNNGAVIGEGTGQEDPGASHQYNFSITFSGITENTSISALTAQLIVTANGGQSTTCTITQAEGNAYLRVEPVTITLAADGSETGTTTVHSNTSWVVA